MRGASVLSQVDHSRHAYSSVQPRGGSRPMMHSSRVRSHEQDSSWSATVEPRHGRWASLALWLPKISSVRRVYQHVQRPMWENRPGFV